MKKKIKIDSNCKLEVPDIKEFLLGTTAFELSKDNDFVEKISSGHDWIKTHLKNNTSIYGVNTGFGESSSNQISNKSTLELQKNLIKYHGCGIDPILSESETLICMVIRLNTLSKGFSGVSIDLLFQINSLIQKKVLPCIPEIGSVGASGDLTPLSYLAAVLCGDREVIYKGVRQETSKVFPKVQIKPYSLKPKEGLAIINGTSVMTAIATHALIRAEYLNTWVMITSSISTEVLKGSKGNFEPFISEVKPYPGQLNVSQKISNWLSTSKIARENNEVINQLKGIKVENEGVKLNEPVQDRYSIRCSPQIIGVFSDTLSWVKHWIEIEMNSVNDNPLIDPGTGKIFNGGNFYGGHVTQAMDSLRVQIGNLADLIDRQLALIFDEKYSRGLPANLVDSNKKNNSNYHGFKALQINISALTSEIISLCNPISIYSRPTESNNQDKVSLGTISARKTREVLDLMDYVISIQLIALSQAMDIRGIANFSTLAKFIHENIRYQVKFLDQDKELDKYISKLRKWLNDIRLIDPIFKKIESL